MQQVSFNGVASFQGVDKDKGRIYGVSVMSVGEAIGHRMYVRPENMDEIVAYGNQSGKVRVRNGHGGWFDGSPTGTEMGYLSNFRKTPDGQRALADFTAIPTEANRSSIDHTLTFAELMPEAIAMSAVFGVTYGADAAVEEETGMDTFTVVELAGVDFVSDPAANPGGLFSMPKSITAAFADNPALADSWRERIQQSGAAVPEFVSLSLFQPNPTQPAMSAGKTPAAPAQQPESNEAETVTVSTNFFTRLLGLTSNTAPAPETEAEAAPDAEVKEPEAKPEEAPEPAPTEEATVEAELSSGQGMLQFSSTGGGSVIALSANENGEIVPAPAAPGYYQLKNGNDLIVDEKGEVQAYGERNSFAMNKARIQFDKSNPTPHQPPAPSQMNTGQRGAATERFSKENILELSRLLTARKTATKPEERRELNQAIADFAVPIEGLSSSHDSRFKKFASTLTTTDVTARIADISTVLLPELFAVDPFLSNINIINNTTRNGLNNFNIELPTFDATDVVWARGALGCSPTETGTVTLAQRLLTVRAMKFAHSFCAADFRDLYQGVPFRSDYELPFEATLVMMVGESLRRDLVRNAIVGNYGGGTDVFDGILDVIDTAFTNSDIPSGQQISQQAYTASNAIEQVEELIEGATDVMKGRDDLVLYSDFNIRNKYIKNYRASFPAAFGPIRPDEDIFTQNIAPMARFLPMTQMSADRAILTPPSNILMVLQDASAWDPMEVFYDQDDRRIKLRWETFAGVTYGRPELVVANLDDATA